ncbi:hypothetical protein Pla110_32660 [Polystyrenella longa]|uniref:Uncharacterized protein n=1 Tax=Polystyrenella longa TaxID=2528007 RepID=A0A518CQP8_9PLAN|nr:hypothetical protein [Polystyrenella longa]QDU81524.1 hypothetical protein Pla110_32660 [Polystyrenella longa]
MANSENNFWLKMFLVFFVFLTIGLSVFLFMVYRSNFDLENQNSVARGEAGNAKNQQDQIARQLDGVMEKIGIKDTNPEGVIEKLEKQLADVSSENASGTVAAAIVAQRDKLQNEKRRADELQRELVGTVSDMQNNKKIDEDRIQAEAEAKTKAQRDLQEVQDRSEEQINKLTAEADQLTDSLRQLQIEYDQYKDTAEQKQQELQTNIRNMSNTINQLQDEVAQLLDLSFEKADGKIIRTDFDNNLVWINIGSSSGLMPQTRFSVYLKKNRGVARGTDEVKGAIEVTEILDDNLSIASIIDEDLGRPIAAGDPIYSPAWSAGGELAISLVGLIDLDGDGYTDRDRFHELLKQSQSVVDNEVDDKGNRTGEGISVDTKFLVVGEIPSVSIAKTEGAAIDNAVAEKIADAHKSMVAEAREQGVRVLTLQDFLQYIGYRPTQRLWMRTSGRPWNLKHGQRLSDAAIESGKYESSGTVSGYYTRDRKLPPYESSGRVSELYKKVKKQYP